MTLYAVVLNYIVLYSEVPIIIATVMITVYPVKPKQSTLIFSSSSVANS